MNLRFVFIKMLRWGVELVPNVKHDIEEIKFRFPHPYSHFSLFVICERHTGYANNFNSYQSWLSTNSAAGRTCTLEMGNASSNLSLNKAQYLCH